MSNVSDLLKQGLQHQQRGEVKDAEAIYRRVLRIDSANSDACHLLGVAALQQRKYTAAVEHIEAAIQRNPRVAEYHNNLAAAHKSLGNLDESVHCFETALAIDPGYAEGAFNLGTLLKDKGLYERAAEQFQCAINIRSDFAQAHNNLGITQKYLRQFDAALGSFDRALEIDPGYADAHYNRATARLLLSDYGQGWPEYEWRKQSFGGQPVAGIAEWDGQQLVGKRVFVYPEQGIGDEIMFASCLPDLIRSAGSCVVISDSRLCPLFVRSFPKARFLPNGTSLDQAQLQSTDFDFQIAVGSLPGIFRPTIDSFPRREQFLQVDPRKHLQWRRRFDSLGHGLKVGISWRGGKSRIVHARRTISLDQWTPVFSVPGLSFINLQYGETREEISKLFQQQGVVIHHWDDSNPLEDLDGFAAQIAALDVIISVDNSTVHLAGALGIPVWAILPAVPDWRWGLAAKSCQWYRSVTTYRQDAFGDWRPVLNRVADALHRLSFAHHCDQKNGAVIPSV